MPYIKKLMMHGFKSFPVKTEIPFENSMNVIVGPNGSGKSNITDALCFVLGRLSIKSIRAAKAANLLFSGNKNHKASQEASVEIIFDNSNKIFALDSLEISIKRIVRRNGLSIYKINNETKTRQELLELLAQAGIDPNGFNIVLQGEIASLIKLSPEERRKIIEEVAGISIYETRKQKSVREMEKIEEKLKEASAIVRERNSYLRNLEKERQDALNYQKLEETIKKCKATIILKNMEEKKKGILMLNNRAESQNRNIEKIKNQMQKNDAEIAEIQEKISRIGKQIQLSTDNEQETLHRDISDLKASLAGLNVRKENFEVRLEENKRKKIEFQKKIEELESEISKIKTFTPEIKEQQKKHKNFQDNFDALEKDRRKFYIIKSELSVLENKKSEKQKSLIESKKESEIIQRNISSLFDEIKFAKSIEKSVQLKHQIQEEIQKTGKEIFNLEEKELETQKTNAILLKGIEENEKLKQEIIGLDVCPLCRNKITEQHINNVIDDANKKIENFTGKDKQNRQLEIKIHENLQKLRETLTELKSRLNEIEIDIIKIRNADEKKEQIKKIAESQEQLTSELKEIDNKILILKKDFENLKNVENLYDEARLKVQELSFADINVDTEVSIKQRELGRLKIEIKSSARDIEESIQELKQINEKISSAENLVDKKEKEEQELYEKFQKFFNEKNELQDKQKAIETAIIGFQHEVRSLEEKINMLKIEKARHDAELDSLKFEFREFESFGVYSMPLEQVRERLQKAQFRISELGSVNLKAVDVYETIKQQCAEIEQKVSIIYQEKEKILKIIEEIDKKKKKSFMRTLEAVNEYFTRNFSQLSRKGEVFLELENPQDPFAAGINILIKVAKGKYFDITSLSGGEKTLVALSLIFAIQEYKPYCFYIFDEIDAALDKHNSELLAALIKKYMVSGQYIIVTHNDALISEASTLYGVSMQENVSKVISLKI